MGTLNVFFVKLLLSPIKMAVLIGLLAVILLPPIVPHHRLFLDNNFSAPNRMYAYYGDSTGMVKDMSFLRESNTSIKLESINNRLFFRPDYTVEDYQRVYIPIPPPKRDWVFIRDLDNDEINEVFYVSQLGDSTLLHVTNNRKENREERVQSLSIPGELNYHYSRFYYFEETNNVYFSLGNETDKSFETQVFRYDFVTDSLEPIVSLHGYVTGYQFEGYDEQLLFVNKVKSKTTFTSVDLQSRSQKSYVLGSSDLTKFYTKKNILTHPFTFNNDMFLFHNREVLFYADIHNLMVNHKLVGTSIQGFDNAKEKIMLKYAKDDVIFYSVGNKEGAAIYKYSLTTNRRKRIRIKGNPTCGTIIYYGDLDNNGKNEIVFTDMSNGNEAYCILEEGSYSDLCRYPIDREKLKVANCALQPDGSLLFQSVGIEYYVRYENNPRYYVHWLWTGALFCVILILGVLIQKINENRDLRRRETNSRIQQLQLENVQKRIDPHFIFNSLNNLGSLILEGDSNESYDYLSKVSGVLYKALRNRSILVTIEEELSFCTSVLDAQRQRFKGKFDYEVFIDREVDLMLKMPSNILNSMVDNCIKHGFSGIEYFGMITIEILDREEGFLLVIEDNGKGRKAGLADQDQTKSTGTGLEICNQYVSLLNNERKNNRLTFYIFDLYNDDKSPKGTRCEYYIPNDLALA